VRRRRILAAGVFLVAVAAIAGAAVVVSGAAPHAAAGSTAAAAPTTRLAAVVRKTLVASQPVTGQVTSSETWTVGLPTGPGPTEVAAATDAAAAATDQLAAARAALLDATRTRALMDSRDTAAVAAAPPGAPRRDAIRARSLDRIQQNAAVSTSQAAVADAERNLAAANRDLAAKRAGETAAGGTVTGLPAAGSTVERGGSLYELSGRPTVLLIGAVPAYRALREGDAGPDVAQLQANLVALGAGGSPAIRTDGTFDHATTLAVQRWQTTRHVEASGIVRVGDVVVLPAAIRVRAVHVAVGGGVEAGTPMLDVASVDEIVSMKIDPALAPRLHVGDAMSFTTPDGTDVSGSIESIGLPTASTEDGPNGPAGRLEVEVIASASDPSALAGLDGVSLTANITTGTAPDALAVPVAALVVLADGSFGVEVAAAGSTRFVRVTPGIYDRTMVEIQGDGLAAGDQVVVPGS
jgi:peptidoglycan hydrolase-like protein with peptidoglycan-binding domain